MYNCTVNIFSIEFKNPWLDVRFNNPKNINDRPRDIKLPIKNQNNSLIINAFIFLFYGLSIDFIFILYAKYIVRTPIKKDR